jgi:hypothetical protein
MRVADRCDARRQIEHVRGDCGGAQRDAGRVMHRRSQLGRARRAFSIGLARKAARADDAGEGRRVAIGELEELLLRRSGGGADLPQRGLAGLRPLPAGAELDDHSHQRGRQNAAESGRASAAGHRVTSGEPLAELAHGQRVQADGIGHVPAASLREPAGRLR